MESKRTSDNASLSRREAAAYLGLSVKTLAAWACYGTVRLPYAKLGRRVVYRQSDLDRFIADRMRTSTN